MSLPNICVSDFDFVRIKKLLSYYHNKELENEMERANIINCILVPSTLVTMESKVIYVDHDEKYEKETTLVLTHSPINQDQVVSVLSPLGTALIGLEVGQKVLWTIGDRKKTLEVLDVPYQPEANGNLHPLTFLNEFHDTHSHII